MSQNAQLQRDLDVLISRTEEELANLRSQRNALSTISQLAPELFSAIFSAYLVDFEPYKERRQGLQTLCRVSRAWRDMVFSDTDIWSTLYLGYRANEAFVKLALANSLDRPLRLRIEMLGSNLYSAHTFWKILSMVCSDAGQRIRHIDVLATPDDLEGILRATGGVQSTVASLRIEAYPPSSENAMLPVELYGSEVPPNLRRLELEGVAIPWSSPILSPRNLLTHIKLIIRNPAYTSNTTSITHLYEFLKSASQLKSLILLFSVGEEEEFHFPSIPFVVSSLETIVITSFYGEQLSALLSAFRFPNLQNITINWMLLQPATGLLSSINGAIKGHAGPLEPQEMYVGDGELGVSTGGGSFHIDLYQRYNPYANGRSPPTLRQAKPWINLSAAFLDRQEPYVFPFHHPSAYTPSWSFSDLRVICVHTASFPGFWEMLAQLPALETIEICPSSRVTKDFLGALAGEAILADEQRNTATFPALRSVLFQSWDPYRDNCAREALAVSVVRALEARASKVGKSSGESPLRLESLEFLSCEEAISQRALEALNRVASIVVWKFNEGE